MHLEQYSLLVFSLGLIWIIIFMMRYRNYKQHRTNLINRKYFQNLLSQKETSNANVDQIPPISYSESNELINQNVEDDSVNNLSINNDKVNNRLDTLNGNYNDDFDLYEHHLCCDDSENDDDANSEPDECTDQLKQFKEDLASLFVEIKLPQSHADKVLRLLKNHICFEDLPLSTKTLLNTPRKPFQSTSMPPGEYYHVGLEQVLIEKLELLPPSSAIPQFLSIDIHVDGMSIHTSKNTQFWPIQIRVNNIFNDKASIVGIYMGNKKPCDPENYLKYFVDEFKYIQGKKGVHFKGQIIPVYLRALIADAPARAFVLNHKGHNSYKPCSKCTITGKYISRRMTFANFDFQPREPDEYKKRTDGAHHLPQHRPGLATLMFDYVNQVPFEYMHLVCIGVVKKFITYIINNTIIQKSPAAVSDSNIISKRLLHLQSFCPKEFARRPRDLSELKHFKATEFRQILLYTGLVVFKGVLRHDIYLHFLLLHTACRTLMVSSPSSTNISYASAALHKYVEDAVKIFGDEYITYNVHGLLHLAEDVGNFGNLNLFSAFAYEDNMRFFRQYLRKPHLLLQQLFKRLDEEKKNLKKKHISKNKLQLQQSHNNGPILQEIMHVVDNQYKQISFEHFSLKANSKRDSCIILNNGIIVEVLNIIKIVSGQILLIVNPYLNNTDFYTAWNGTTSSLFGVYCISNLSSNLVAVELNEIYAKCFKMPHFFAGQSEVIPDEFIAVALLSNV